MRSENAKQNDTFIMINGKWVYDRDWVDGFKIHKCFNAYLVYIKMLRNPDNTKQFGQEYEITVCFQTLEELLNFQRQIFSDQDVGSSKVTEKFKNFIDLAIPKYQPGGEK